LQGALKLHVRGDAVTEEFIEATRVIQCFYKFPLEAGALVNLSRCGILVQCSVVAAQPDQCRALALVPISFFFR